MIDQGSTLATGVAKLERYILRNNYHGYDRYDGLQSPIFKLPGLRNKKLRFVFQQVTKRLPFNFRPLLAIPKGYNPVTLGLCLQAFSYLAVVYPEKQKFYLQQIEKLIGELNRLQSSGYSGACWGYDFDWEARHASISAFTPTIVATGIISNALYTAHQLTKNSAALELCVRAADFIRKDLNKSFVGELFCYSYSPVDRQIVFNATMKGARLLAQVYSLTGEKSLLDEAAKTVEFVMQHQNANGAWIYAHNAGQNWVDNYHTGYILDCLESYSRLSGDDRFDDGMKLGLHYYRENFFLNDKVPKFYDKKCYPIDCTAAAQSLLTLARFSELEIAQNVGEWMVQNMQAPDGHFYYRKYKYFTSKVSFMRWSNAWMFAGLTYFLFKMDRNR